GALRADQGEPSDARPRDRVPRARGASAGRDGQPVRARRTCVGVHRVRRGAPPPSRMHEVPAGQGPRRDRRRAAAGVRRPPPRVPGRSRGARLLRSVPKLPPKALALGLAIVVACAPGAPAARTPTVFVIPTQLPNGRVEVTISPS